MPWPSGSMRTPRRHSGCLEGLSGNEGGPLPAEERRAAASSVAPISTDAGAPCVLASLAFRTASPSPGFLDKPLTHLPVAPKRSLGQHFLVDENLLGVIDRLADLAADDVVLEVGPGLGVLTRHLAGRVRHVHAVELDRALEGHLVHALVGARNVALVFGDALRLDLSTLEPAPQKLVANLPYSIATPLIVETLEGLPALRHWCVMVQREVADRLFAHPSTRAYGAVSVLVQLASERTGFHPVARTVFRPQPRVESALVAFRRVPAPSSYAWVKRVVEAAFAHRRKTLPNSVSLTGLASRLDAAAALEALGRAPQTRAEALAPAEFVALAVALASRS